MMWVSVKAMTRFGSLGVAIAMASVLLVVAGAGCGSGDQSPADDLPGGTDYLTGDEGDIKAEDADTSSPGEDIGLDRGPQDATCGSCTGGKICYDGECRCPATQKDCNGICTTMGTNEDCSDCGDVCPTGGSCQAGRCGCPSGQVDCDGICAELGTDANCSDCGDVCVGTKKCTNKKCVAQVDPECLPTVPCVSDDDCVSGSRCNEAITPPACQKLYCGGFGTACSKDYFCLSMLCDDNQCVHDCSSRQCGPDAVYGESCGTCSRGWHCEAGECICTGNNCCNEDIQCAGGKCTDGVCVIGQCSDDADCGCEMLECVGGSCEISSDFIVEIEPNDDLDSAQLIPGPKASVAASLLMTGPSVDIDLFKVHLSPGQALDVITEPFCNQEADTFIRLVADDGTPIDGWENDDIDPYGWFFSWLNGFVAERDMDVYIEVVQSPYVPGFARFNYVLSVNIFQIAENSTCDGAIALGAGSQIFDIASAVNSYMMPSCTGYGAAGKDMAFALTVEDGVRISIDAPFDAQLALVTDCDDPNGSCLTGIDNLWEPGVETLLWVNPSDTPAEVFLIVDSFYMAGDSQFELTVEYFDVTPPENDQISGAIFLEFGTPVAITNLGATNDYDGLDFGCDLNVPLVGPDVVYKVEFLPGDFGVFKALDIVGHEPVIYLVTTDDGVNPAQCLAIGRDLVSWEAGAEPVTAYLIIDQIKAQDYSSLSLIATLGPPENVMAPVTQIPISKPVQPQC